MTYVQVRASFVVVVNKLLVFLFSSTPCDPTFNAHNFTVKWSKINTSCFPVRLIRLVFWPC